MTRQPTCPCFHVAPIDRNPAWISFPAMLASRRAAVLFAILAMTLRGLLPAGWMPNPDGMRETALIICDMDTPSAMAHVRHEGMSGMDMTGPAPASHHKHADDGHSQPCPFAAAPHVATPSLVAVLALPPLTVSFAHPRDVQGSRIADAIYTPQSPRAPPILA